MQKPRLGDSMLLGENEQFGFTGRKNSPWGLSLPLLPHAHWEAAGHGGDAHLTSRSGVGETVECGWNSDT